MLLNAVIEKDEDGYFAYVPDMKGCVSQGDTYEEALSNIKEAAKLYLESLKSDELLSIQSKHTMIAPIEVALHGWKTAKTYCKRGGEAFVSKWLRARTPKRESPHLH